MSTTEDKRAFAEAMRGVTPIRQTQKVTSTVRPEPRARHSRAARAALIDESVNGAREHLEQHGEEISFRRPGVSEATFRRLQRGRFRIDAELDLHGLGSLRAKTALRDFLAEAVERNLRCVRVIHGKGMRSGPAGPVLKQGVQAWLCRMNDVLAFVSARLRDGGSGAVYVLLRKR